MDKQLILNDGTTYIGSDCGYADKMLWCYVKGISFGEAFAAFSDPEKTKSIRFLYGDTEEIYTGFTELNLLRKSEFTVDIRMLSPGDSNVETHKIEIQDGEVN